MEPTNNPNQGPPETSISGVPPESVRPSFVPSEPPATVLETQSFPAPSPLSNPPPHGGAHRFSHITSLLRRRSIWIPALVILLTLVGGVIAWRLNRHKVASPAPSSNQLQDVSAEQLKNFTNSFLTPSTTQTVSITPNTEFANNLSVGKTLTAAAITTNNFSIVGGTSLDSVNVKSNLFVGGGSTLQGDVEARNQLTVRGSLAAANASFGGNVAVAGTLSAGSLAIGELNTRNVNTINIIVNGHIVSGGGGLTAEPGTALGAGGKVVVAGNDTSGSIFINSGSGPAAGQLAIIHFNTGFGITPHVILSPVDDRAGSLQWYVTRSTKLFDIDSASTPPPNQQMKFDYFVIQ